MSAHLTNFNSFSNLCRPLAGPTSALIQPHCHCVNRSVRRTHYFLHPTQRILPTIFQQNHFSLLTVWNKPAATIDYSDLLTLPYVIPLDYSTTGLLKPVNNPASCEVIRGELDQNLVTWQNLDKIFPHSPGDMRKYLVLVLQFDLEHRIGQRLQDRRLYLNGFFF